MTEAGNVPTITNEHSPLAKPGSQKKHFVHARMIAYSDHKHRELLELALKKNAIHCAALVDAIN